MFEAIFQFLVEFLLQAVVEFLAELGLHALKEPFHRRPSPWLAIPGYAVIGGLLGAVSVLLFPTHFSSPGVARIVVVVLVPFFAGLLMSAIGAWRVRRGQAVLRIDRFLCGYLFALCFALARHCFAA